MLNFNVEYSIIWIVMKYIPINMVIFKYDIDLFIILSFI